MNTLDDFFQTQPPTQARPLLGLTVLAVEDSKFACEAIRLMCLRSGARIRRADCLASAHRHLRVYSPSVLIVDTGLPDGSGTDLIAEMHAAPARIPVILGTSGDDGAAEQSLAAGADGFFAKPIASLAAFQAHVLDHLPRERHPKGPRRVTDETVEPDTLAYQDDLAHALQALTDGHATYAAQFVSGVALSVKDTALFNAARAVTNHAAERQYIQNLSQIITQRLNPRIAV